MMICVGLSERAKLEEGVGERGGKKVTLGSTLTRFQGVHFVP